MKKTFKKITAMAAMSLLVAAQVPAANILAADGVATKEKTTTKQPSIYGQSGIVIDAKSGKILFQKKIDDRHYPASITKILTTLVAIENNKDLYDEVTFSSYAVNSIEPGSTHIGIQAGEKIPLIDVLNAIMLESANEACNGAAEHTAGTTKKFVELMNKKWQRFQRQHLRMKHSVTLHANQTIISHQRIRTSMEKNYGIIIRW